MIDLQRIRILAAFETHTHDRALIKAWLRWYGYEPTLVRAHGRTVQTTATRDYCEAIRAEGKRR